MDCKGWTPATISSILASHNRAARVSRCVCNPLWAALSTIWLTTTTDSMKIATLMYPVVAETMAEAEDKKAAYDKLPNDTDSLSLLSEALNFDFARKGLDEPFTTEEIDGIAGMQAMRDRVLQLSGNPNPTPRDFMHYTGRGRLENAWVGGPKEIADMFEHAWPTTTRHIQMLEWAGLLHHERQGRNRVYHIDRRRLELVRDWLAWFSKNPH